MVFNDPGPGVLPRCNFISSGVDHIDFGIAAQYNLILSFIKHRDIPLPWRGVRVLCTRTGWLFPARIQWFFLEVSVFYILKEVL